MSIGKRSRPAEEQRSAWLQQASSCKACVAKLRPQQGSIAAALWRSARSIEFLNQAIRFANRKSANRDNGPHSRGAKRPSCWLCKALFKREGAGKAGCWPHPWPPRERNARGVDHRYRRDNPAFPARWVTTYTCSSVNHPVCHRRLTLILRKAWRQTSGRQDHTTLSSAKRAVRRSAPSRPPHPPPHVS